MENPRPETAGDPAVAKNTFIAEASKRGRMNPGVVIDNYFIIKDSDLHDPQVEALVTALESSKIARQAVLDGFRSAGDDASSIDKLLIFGKAIHMNRDHSQLFAAFESKLLGLVAQRASQPAAQTTSPATNEQARAAGTTFGGHVGSGVDNVLSGVRAVAGKASGVTGLVKKGIDLAFPDTGINAFAPEGSAQAARVIPDADRARALEGLSGGNPAAKALFDKMATDEPGRLNDLIRKFLDAERRIQPINDVVEVISSVLGRNEIPLQAVKQMLVEDPGRVERWINDLRDFALNLPVEYWPSILKDRIPPGDPDTLAQRGKEYLRTHHFNIAEIRQLVAAAEADETEPALPVPQEEVQRMMDDERKRLADEAHRFPIAPNARPFGDERARILGYKDFDDWYSHEPTIRAMLQIMGWDDPEAPKSYFERDAEDFRQYVDEIRTMSEEERADYVRKNPHKQDEVLRILLSEDDDVDSTTGPLPIPQEEVQRMLEEEREKQRLADEEEEHPGATVTDEQRKYIEEMIEADGGIENNGLENARRRMGNWGLPRPGLIETDKQKKDREQAALRRDAWWDIFNQIEGVDRPLPTVYVPDPEPPEPEEDAEKKPVVDSETQRKIDALFEELKSIPGVANTMVQWFPNPEARRVWGIREELNNLLPGQDPNKFDSLIQGWINQVPDGYYFISESEIQRFVNPEVREYYNNLFSQPGLEEIYRTYLLFNIQLGLLLNAGESSTEHLKKAFAKSYSDLMTIISKANGQTDLWEAIDAASRESLAMASDLLKRETPPLESVAHDFKAWTERDALLIDNLSQFRRKRNEFMQELALRMGLKFEFDENGEAHLVPLSEPGDGGGKPPADEPIVPQPTHHLADPSTQGIRRAIEERKTLVDDPDFEPLVITQGRRNPQDRQARIDQALGDRSTRETRLQEEVQKLVDASGLDPDIALEIIRRRSEAGEEQ